MSDEATFFLANVALCSALWSVFFFYTSAPPATLDHPWPKPRWGNDTLEKVFLEVFLWLYTSSLAVFALYAVVLSGQVFGCAK